MTVVHNKIVRDQIPEIIAAAGKTAVTRQLAPGEATSALLDKLQEEADELRAASPDGVADELADLLEVVRALAVEYGVRWPDLIRTADTKARERGGFTRRIWLERVD